MCGRPSEVLCVPVPDPPVLSSFLGAQLIPGPGSDETSFSHGPPSVGRDLSFRGDRE